MKVVEVMRAIPISLLMKNLLSAVLMVLREVMAVKVALVAKQVKKALIIHPK